MKKYPLALFIGRFQPFHNGHLYSLKKACEVGEKVIIGIGSSNRHDVNNPWDFETRRRMVEVVLDSEGLRERVQAIWAIPDTPSDSDWARDIVQSLQEEGYLARDVVGIGNNNWTNNALRTEGITVIESGLYNRDELEGVKIREMIRQGELGWKERIPRAVSDRLMLNLTQI